MNVVVPDQGHSRATCIRLQWSPATVPAREGAMGRSALLLVSRLLFAVLFVPSGFQALANIAGTTSYFAGLRLPLQALAAWGTGLFELIAGLLILVGLQTRIVALLLAGFC